MTRILTCLALVACGGGEPSSPAAGGEDSAADTGGDAISRPDAICNSSSAWTGGEVYTQTTDDWGLTDVHGTRLSTADINGDGYPDLIVTEGTAFGQDDFSSADGTRYHYVLMNIDDGAGGRTFEDQTVASGLLAPRDGDASTTGRAGMVHVFGDVDGDGDLDAFSGQFYDGSNDSGEPGDRSELMLNNGDGTFTMADKQPFWVDGGYATSGASFTDVDGDGALDLWVVGWYETYGQLYGEQDHLYKGDGAGNFTEVTADAGLEMRRGNNNDSWIDGLARRPAFGATSCDLNGDALPDLLTSNYGRSWNQQWMNDGSGSFTDTSMATGFASDGENDYGDNQFYRCYCEVYGCDPDPGPSSMGGCETYAAYWSAGWDDQPHRLNGNSFSTACGDIDNDGDNDLITAEIVHWHIGGSSDPTELLLNDGTGTFTRPGNDSNGLERRRSGSWNEGDLMVAFTDFDSDGWKDILLVSSDYPDNRMSLFRQIAPGQFDEIATEAGIDHPWPASSAIADFDRDGDMDVITGSSTARTGTPWSAHEIHFYENTLGAGNAMWIQLEGTDANRAGIGARIEVTAGGITQQVEVGGGYGHMGMQNDLIAHLGLGDACSVDEVTVTWPGGAVDTWTGVLPNYLVTLQQGGGETYANAR